MGRCVLSNVMAFPVLISLQLIISPSSVAKISLQIVLYRISLHTVRDVEYFISWDFDVPSIYLAHCFYFAHSLTDLILMSVPLSQ